MDLLSFRASLDEETPPDGAPPGLRALWWAAKGDWDEAHGIAQDMPDPDGAWVHGHLHREEGDLDNARYWYGRAGRAMPQESIGRERERILLHFLSVT